LQGVKDHLLSEACKAELRWDIPATRILVGRTSAAKVFSYFLTPKSRAPPARGYISSRANHRQQ
jgi:hypothetical protein